MIKHIKQKQTRRHFGPTTQHHHHHHQHRTAMLLRLLHSCSPHHNSLNNPFACLFLFLVVFLSCFANPALSACNQLDQDSLLSFSLNLSSSPLNWSSRVDCCLWEGIACDSNDRVTRLRLPFRGLSGLFSPSIQNLTGLSQLNLSHNFLSGPLPDGFFTSLNRLEIIDLSDNGLTGVIPQDIGKLSNLEQLLLHINQLNGTLPPSLMNCTNLKTLNLRENSFDGELSSLDFSSLSQLSTLDLGNNNFTGILPVSLYSCKSLTAIRLATNQLEGQILPDVLALQSLSFLSISNNSLTNFTGAIRILMGCKNLSVLIMSRNFYNESISDDENIAGSEVFQNLKVLGLGVCGLRGQIPAWLAKLGKLEVLDLSVNQITGSIPGWLGTLPNLFYLDLSFNLLLGDFPKELTQIPTLVSDQVADQIDRSYLELPVFIQPNVAFNNMQYKQLANLPRAIYLKNNSLNGNIPVEIGQLKSIHVLDLSMNNFFGNIPDQMSNLNNLEKLDLSGNHLSGEIPVSLRSLNFLSSFSVADNNLQGPIPTGGQFDTFSISSFEGNPGLCGPVLQYPCSTQPESMPPSAHNEFPKESPKEKRSDPNGKEKIIVELIDGIGFGVSFTLTVIALSILSKRRILTWGKFFLQLW